MMYLCRNVYRLRPLDGEANRIPGDGRASDITVFFRTRMAHMRGLRPVDVLFASAFLSLSDQSLSCCPSANREVLDRSREDRARVAGQACSWINVVDIFAHVRKVIHGSRGATSIAKSCR